MTQEFLNIGPESGSDIITTPTAEKGDIGMEMLYRLENGVATAASDLLTGGLRTDEEVRKYNEASAEYAAALDDQAQRLFNGLLLEGLEPAVAFGRVRDMLLESKIRVLTSEASETLDESLTHKLAEKATSTRALRVMTWVAIGGATVVTNYAGHASVDLINQHTEAALIGATIAGGFLVKTAKSLAGGAIKMMPKELGDAGWGLLEKYNIKDKEEFAREVAELGDKSEPDYKTRYRQLRRKHLILPEIRATEVSINAIIGEVLASGDELKHKEAISRLVGCLDSSIDRRYGAEAEAHKEARESRLRKLGSVATDWFADLFGSFGKFGIPVIGRLNNQLSAWLAKGKEDASEGVADGVADGVTTLMVNGDGAAGVSTMSSGP